MTRHLPALLLYPLFSLLLPASAMAAKITDTELSQFRSTVEGSCQKQIASLNNLIGEKNIALVCQCSVDRLTEEMGKLSDDDADLLRKNDPDMQKRWTMRAIQVVSACTAPKLSDALQTMVLNACHTNPAQVSGKTDGKLPDGSDACPCISTEFKKHYPTEESLTAASNLSLQQTPEAAAQAKAVAVKYTADAIKLAQAACFPAAKP